MTEFVLVHGTTQSPADWDRLADELRRRGHPVTAVDLPAGQPQWAPADYARHVAAQPVTACCGVTADVRDYLGQPVPTVASRAGRK